MNYNPYGMYNNGVNFPVNMPQMGFDPMMKIQEMEQEILQLKGKVKSLEKKFCKLEEKTNYSSKLSSDIGTNNGSLYMI